MFALAAELQKKNIRVVTSTTTKIWQKEAEKSRFMVYIEETPSWEATLSEELKNLGHVFLGSARLDTGKVEGITPFIADKLYREQPVDVLILEADGAAGRPVKAPERHEPVIPHSTTMVIAMLGLEAVGDRCHPEIVFRTEVFERLTGVQRGDIMTPDSLANLFLRPEGLFKGAPRGSKKVAFLNKCDLLSDEGPAIALAERILEKGFDKITGVVVGSVLQGIYYVKLSG
jgi:probable selenium-dependent hydroxylase accessory protein YqeC